MLRMAKASPGPTPWAPRSNSKAVRSSAEANPYKVMAPLTDVGVHGEKGLVTRLQPGRGFRGNDKAVAHAGDVYDHLDGGVPDRLSLGHDAPQGCDHGRAPVPAVRRLGPRTGAVEDARAQSAVLR